MGKTTCSGNAGLPATALLSGVEVTSDTLTGRGGLVLFSRYMRNLGILPELERLFGEIRKSGKGLGVAALFHQLFCFLVDGTSRHLVYWDALKKDAGYAGAIETAPEQMASSHTVKRCQRRLRSGQIQRCKV